MLVVVFFCLIHSLQEKNKIIDEILFIDKIYGFILNPLVIINRFRNLLVITDGLRNLSVNLYIINLSMDFRCFRYISLLIIFIFLVVINYLPFLMNIFSLNKTLH